MAFKTKSKVQSGFSMASMTDIVFLLLIFFIIVSTMVSPYGLKMLLPSTSHKKVSAQNKNAKVTISENGNFTVNGTTVTETELENSLMKAVNQSDKKAVVLYANKKSALKQTVFVMNIASRNKIDIVLASNK